MNFFVDPALIVCVALGGLLVIGWVYRLYKAKEEHRRQIVDLTQAVSCWWFITEELSPIIDYLRGRPDARTQARFRDRDHAFDRLLSVWQSCLCGVLSDLAFDFCHEYRHRGIQPNDPALLGFEDKVNNIAGAAKKVVGWSSHQGVERWVAEAVREFQALLAEESRAMGLKSGLLQPRDI